MIDWRQYVRIHLPALDIPAEREVEIREELAQQLESVYVAARAGGCSEDEAIARATDEITDWHELSRSLSRIESRADLSSHIAITCKGGLMRGFLLDLRHATRGLLRSPAYVSIATLTLALGLGLGVAAFSLVDQIVLQPLPYPAAEQLVLLKATVPPENRDTAEITYPDAIDMSSATQAFRNVAALIPFAGTTTSTDPPSRIEGFEVSASLFETLGVSAALGRTFNSADARANAPLAMVGYGFWQRLGAPADIVGRVLMINEVPSTVVGVLPDDFRVELMQQQPADIFLLLTDAHPFAANRGIRAFRVIARLNDGVSPAQADAAAATIGERLQREYPLTNDGRMFMLRPLQEEIVGPVRSQLWLIAGLVFIVLLVAAVNLAGLILTRTVGQMRDVTVRLALGASRWRLARESITESLLVSALGAIAGAVLASVALDLVRAAPGIPLPRLAGLELDTRAFAGLTLAAITIACSVGLVPLALTRHFAPTASLRTGHETASRPAIRLHSALIVGQTSFAFLLLAAAALLAASLRAVLDQPLGFESTNVVTMRVAVPESRYVYREDTVVFYTELLESLRANPSVQSAGVVSVLPLAGNTGSTLTIQGREETPLALRPTIGWHWASPGYFSAIGIPILRGRDFRSDDINRAPHVTVINETMARLHFAGEDPIGKRVYFGGFGPGGPPEWHEVIGIVGDVRHRQLDAAPDARAYDLFGQHWGRTISLAIRTSDRPLHVAGLVRSLLAQRDPRLAVFSIRTTADLVSQAVARRRLLLWVVSALAIAGLIVSLIGLYGAVAYMVTQRTREMGVRLALGATAPQIRRLVMSRGLQLVGAGLVTGSIASVPLGRALETQLFGIAATNIPALTAAAALLVAAALAACLVPAIRATQVNPVDSLRAE